MVVDLVARVAERDVVIFEGTSTEVTRRCLAVVVGEAVGPRLEKGSFQSSRFQNPSIARPLPPEQGVLAWEARLISLLLHRDRRHPGLRR